MMNKGNSSGNSTPLIKGKTIGAAMLRETKQENRFTLA